MFIFNFTTDFLKMAPIRVRFSPGFPPGAGFHGEEFVPAVSFKLKIYLMKTYASLSNLVRLSL
jgi:hypothetical protein